MLSQPLIVEENGQDLLFRFVDIGYLFNMVMSLSSKCIFKI